MAALIPRKIADEMEERAVTSPIPWISFEFFPPRTEAGVVSLKKVIDTLKPYDPLFVDFTWGAGGSTSELTFDLCKYTKQIIGLNPNMHLTCTNMDMEKIDQALSNCYEAGICNILALRGDPPVGQEQWTASDKDLTCARDLVQYIHKKYPDYFSISVAGYPEGHPASMTELSIEQLDTLSATELQRVSQEIKVIPVEEEGLEGTEKTIEIPILHVCKDHDFQQEMSYLQSKILAGSNVIITQMFFDVEIYGTFVQTCRDYGITVPIVPGIMCISNYGGFQRMIKFCKTRVPEEIMKTIESLKDNAEAIKAYGIELGVKTCQRLQELGAPGFHFYTLNTSAVTIAIIERLGYHSKMVKMKEETVVVTA